MQLSWHIKFIIYIISCRYNSSFGDDYYSFWCSGILHIVVNSQFWHDRSQVEREASDQDQWLEGQLTTLKESGAKFGIIFQHIPWFLSNYDEEATPYFTIRPEIRQKWMPKFKEAGNKFHINSRLQIGDHFVLRNQSCFLRTLSSECWRILWGLRSRHDNSNWRPTGRCRQIRHESCQSFF